MLPQLQRLESRITEAVEAGDVVGAFLINEAGGVALGAGELRTEIVLVPEVRHFLNGIASTTSKSGELLVFLQLRVREGPGVTLLGVFEAGAPLAAAVAIVEGIFRGAAEPH